MRWIRLLFLGLASVYPLYWTAQFVLFFLPEALLGFWLGEPVHVIGISYLQATAVVGQHSVFAAHWEALAFAVLFTMLIVGLRGDRYLTGALGIVLLGQSAMLPFLSYWRAPGASLAEALFGCAVAVAVVVFGLYRILLRTGGFNFLDRLALISLLAVLPQAGMWLAFRMAYPFFGTRFLLMLLVPLYVGAIVAAALPVRIGQPDFSSVPWTEILASSAAAGLLILAITLSSRSMNGLSSRSNYDRALAPPSMVHGPDLLRAARLAGDGSGMLT